MENGTEWKSTNIEDRFPFLEFVYPGVNEIAKMKSPRFIKTHLPYQLLPPSIINGAKVGITGKMIHNNDIILTILSTSSHL